MNNNGESSLNNQFTAITANIELLKGALTKGIGKVRNAEYTKEDYIEEVKAKFKEVLVSIANAGQNVNVSVYINWLHQALMFSLGLCAAYIDQDSYLNMIQDEELEKIHQLYLNRIPQHSEARDSKPLKEYGYDELIEQVNVAYNSALEYYKKQKNPNDRIKLPSSPIQEKIDANLGVYMGIIGALFFRMRYPSSGIMYPTVQTERKLVMLEPLYSDFVELPKNVIDKREKTVFDKNVFHRPSAAVRKLFPGFDLDPRVSLADHSLHDENGIGNFYIGTVELRMVRMDDKVNWLPNIIALNPGLIYIGIKGSETIYEGEKFSFNLQRMIAKENEANRNRGRH